MKTIKSVFKIGQGPSSSHTVGPYNAAKLYRKMHPDADAFQVTLYGSLAFTGMGHGTQKAIRAGFERASKQIEAAAAPVAPASSSPSVCVTADTETTDLPHPNTMLFEAFRDGVRIHQVRIFSIGGGTIRVEGEDSEEDEEVYPEKNLSEMLDVCRRDGITLTEFIRLREREGAGQDNHRKEDGGAAPDIQERKEQSLTVYLSEVWHAMEDAVRRGLAADGELPGGLHVQRKAKILYEKRCYNENADVAMNRIIAAYAYAVSEENADEHIVVTAPTCGSCGVLPAVLYYMQHDRGFPENEILDALSVAGLIGNVIRTNASISGAECGCQAEIGSACAMTAAALAALYGLNTDQIEYAAEIAMEHNLGLTCDPVNGLVQIPCIERNAVAAMRAISSVNLSRFLYETRKISFDEVVTTMYRTGKDMDEKYRETSHGGLAQLYKT